MGHLLTFEPGIRAGCFTGVLMAMAVFTASTPAISGTTL